MADKDTHIHEHRHVLLRVGDQHLHFVHERGVAEELHSLRIRGKLAPKAAQQHKKEHQSRTKIHLVKTQRSRGLVWLRYAFVNHLGRSFFVFVSRLTAGRMQGSGPKKNALVLSV